MPERDAQGRRAASESATTSLSPQKQGVSAIAICFAVGTLGIAFPEPVARVTQGITSATRHHFGWPLLAMTLGFLLVCFGLAISPWGRIRLGSDEERPEFSTLSWLAMLFAAGMGQGLLFFGVAEPMQYFRSPLADPITEVAARQALSASLFHWGFHAWGIYCVAALVVAYFAFRRDAPYLIGAPFRSLLADGWSASFAWMADVLALMAVVFGLGAGVALGSQQLAAGLSLVSEQQSPSSVWIMWGVITAAIVSASTNLHHGIRWLSNGNLALMSTLMVAVFVLGPTRYILDSAMETMAVFPSQLFALTTRAHPYTANTEWFESQTLTYFMWWISWAPFVGIFIARISRGRTVRELVAGVIFVPTLFSTASFVTFGATGFHQALAGTAGSAVSAAEPTAAIFTLLEPLPFGPVLKVAALVTVFVFVVTSVDSGTFVLGMLSSSGSTRPPVARRIAWGACLGILSAVFVLAGDVDVVLTMAMSGAAPFALVMLLQTAALLRAMYLDTQPNAAANDRSAGLASSTGSDR